MYLKIVCFNQLNWNYFYLLPVRLLLLPLNKNSLSFVQFDTSLVRYAHSWDIALNTRREIPYLRAPMYYCLYIYFFTVQCYTVRIFTVNCYIWNYSWAFNTTKQKKWITETTEVMLLLKLSLACEKNPFSRSWCKFLFIYLFKVSGYPKWQHCVFTVWASGVSQGP